MTSLQRDLKSQTWITQHTAASLRLWHDVCFIGYQIPLLECFFTQRLLVTDMTELSDILIFWLNGPWKDGCRHTIHTFRCLLILVQPSLVAALGEMFLQSDVRQLKSYSSSWSPRWKESSPHKLLNPQNPQNLFHLAIIACNQMTELQTFCCAILSLWACSVKIIFHQWKRPKHQSNQNKTFGLWIFWITVGPKFPRWLQKYYVCREKKKTQVVLSENTKHFHFILWMGKKKKVKHFFRSFICLQAPTTDRNFELFWCLVGEKFYLVIRGRRTCYKKSHTMLTFAVQRG